MSAYTVANLLRKNRSARPTNPQRLAVVFGERAISYDELEQRADRLASALAARGFSAGQRVAVLLLNRPEYFEVFFAVAKLGGVVVPVNYLFKAPRSSTCCRTPGRSGPSWKPTCGTRSVRSATGAAT